MAEKSSYYPLYGALLPDEARLSEAQRQPHELLQGAARLICKAVSAAAFTWFFVSLSFAVGTLCSEYTRGILFRVGGVQLPPRSSAGIPRPGVGLANSSSTTAKGTALYPALELISEGDYPIIHRHQS